VVVTEKEQEALDNGDLPTVSGFELELHEEFIFHRRFIIQRGHEHTRTGN